MLHRLLALVAALALGGCYASTGPSADPDGDEDVGAVVDPLVDECVATAYASSEIALDPDAAPEGHAVLFANYPVYSPDYVLDRYGDDLIVVRDERFEARQTTTAWGGEGLVDVVFGRRAGELAWRVLADPDAVCPPLPEGMDWPGGD